MTTALRSFLRYARYRGDVTLDLAAAVPVVANWSMPSIPRAISADQTRQLLASIDRRTAVGRRDYAILLLLARLGLRSGEVAFLELDDIDWRAGQLSVRGKGGQRNELPLPADVGKAIAAYLQHGRPHSASRRVFLRVEAPITGFRGPTGVSSVVRHSLQRAGIDAPDDGCSSVPPRFGHPDVEPWGLAQRDRRGVGASSSTDDEDLYGGRHQGIAHTRFAMAGRCTMNTLRQAVQDYLDLRRSLGFKLNEAGKALHDFVTFMEQRRAPYITQALALEWAQQLSNVQPAQWAQRLSYVRAVRTSSQCHRSPHRDTSARACCRFKPKRARPYLYSRRRDSQRCYRLHSKCHIAMNEVHCCRGPIIACSDC